MPRHAARQLVEVVTKDSVLIITMCRVEKRNALNAELMMQLTKAVLSIADDTAIRAVVMTGGEHVFSAGADLGEALKVITNRDFDAFWARGWGLTSAISSCPVPVVAVIEGPCMTGGLEIAMACDFRVASTNAIFAITSARIGSAAGFGATQRLPWLIGPSHAKRMLFSGEPIDADVALSLGLVDEVVAHGRGLDAAFELIEPFLLSSRTSIALAKRAVNFGVGAPSNSNFELERSLSALAFQLSDRAEGMSAFLEHRPPLFGGG